MKSVKKARAKFRKRPSAKPRTRKRGAKPSARRASSPFINGALADRITAHPELSDAKAAKARVAEWLREIAGKGDGRKLKSLVAANVKAAALIHGLADGSPYLWQLANLDPARLLRLLASEPQSHLAHLLDHTRTAVAASRDEAQAMRLLRLMKQEAALLIALADIGGVWDVPRVTRALTDLADTATKAAVDFLLADAARAKRISPPDKKNPAQGSGYIVLAMGKMGAGELNYSSDIDLIVFYDPAAQALSQDAEHGAFFVRLTQRLVKLLAERTPDGYVFRTDLRLRPDPASTPVAISTPAALSYYESTGQNWERAAMIKARPCAGDIAAGEKLLTELSPFVWRKYLDFAALADVKAMKQQIHAFRGHSAIAVEGHNIKLGRGGIREIEFFAQTQQLIAGGRDQTLRDRETLPTLGKLVEAGWIAADARDEMSAAYLFLRALEHRLQMVHDEQTQTLPDDGPAMERFARFFGFKNRDAFAKALVGHLGNVQRQYAKLFEAGSAPDILEFPAEQDDKRTLDRLSEMGFKAPLETSAAVRNWLAGGVRSLRGEFVREQLRELLPTLLENLARTENPDASRVLFDRFLGNLHNPSRLLPLLRQNTALIPLIAMIIGTAPRLADTLARYPQVIDALVDPSFFGALPNKADLEKRLESAIAQTHYDEDLLERVRMFGLEYMFLIGVRILTGTVTAAQAGEAFARLADVVICALHAAVGGHFANMHGHLRKQTSAVLALGKLGGGEMTATSDLDLILIYDFDEQKPESDGKKPLYGGQYFARLTQRLISALTAQTNYGALYQVDMRLRPSGRSGPVATELAGFAAYQKQEAWTWEHMALTRARVVSGGADFRAKVERTIRDILCRERDPAQIAADVVEMRGAIALEKGDTSRWDLKYVSGGLIDIEFIAQYLQLAYAAKQPGILDTATARVLEKARELRLLSIEDAEVLRGAVRLYQNLTQILRLCLSGPFDPKTAGASLLRLLARAADVPDFATLEATLADTQTQVRESFVRILGRMPEAKRLGANRI
ncbi:MAG: bifunctional [glutamine synthetase] adenylyltransferase/[glutamine synthetase]-adenylyl-L-tyrosine phosphorylase [Pseudolabrys sp.]|nr:bifunctional [glutamine synthetase] adenylyltransferase/[glutamine synthetase]-adenylyl-L-tyrosine phosphorylase [Pseudolabrys sp.]